MPMESDFPPTWDSCGHEIVALRAFYAADFFGPELLSPSMPPFELDGGIVADRGVASVRVVPPLEEREDRHASLGLGSESPPIEKLALQCREETLGEGVVVGVAHRSHRWTHAGLAASKPEGDRRVLHPWSE